MRTSLSRSAPLSTKTKHSVPEDVGLVTSQATKSRMNDAIALPRTTNKAYSSHGGAYYVGDTVGLLQSKPFKRLHGQVQLILTSPPYPLNKKKSYGNLTGEAYVEWIKSLAPLFSNLLTDDGSLVIELGNSWEPERPVQSLLALKALMALATAKGTGLRLIQQFICHNPSRLPSPAAWVTVHEHHNLYLAGLEKSGAFVEHAMEIQRVMPLGSILVLSDKYIYRHISPGEEDPKRPYANTSYYGHKVVFRSRAGQMYVVSIPVKGLKKTPKAEDLPNLQAILTHVEQLHCDMYENALLPVALANKLVSLSAHPSSQILKAFAKASVSA